jgi:hypothetical protein
MHHATGGFMFLPRLAAGLLVSCFLFSSSAAIIQSVSTGGLWEDTATWVGNKIPGASDDAVINGTVSVTSSSSQCNNLTVSAASVLQNGGSMGWIDFTILGNAINNGTIRNNPTANAFHINFCGNVTNNGVWILSSSYFTSQRSQSISQASGMVFCGNFYKKNTNGYSDTFPLIAGSNLVFNATEIEFQGSKDGAYFWGKFNMAGYDLTLCGAMPLGRTVLSGIGNFIFKDSSSMYSSVINDPVTLKGAVTITDANVTFNGVVTNADTLQNGGSLGWLAAHFNARLINNGTIRSNPRGSQFNVELAADVVNNGKWVPGQTYFVSKTSQTISQTAGTEFCGVISKKNVNGSSDTFPLVAASDIVINSSSFDCMGNNGAYFWGKINMAGHDLTLAGATPLANASVSGLKNFMCIDSSSISSCSIYDAVTLKGKFTITDANVTFNGVVTNADTLQNGGSLGWLAAHFNARLINNGTLRSNPRGYQFNVELAGDVTNNGKWLPGQTYFVSKAVQTISQAPGTEFCGVITKKNVNGSSDTFPLVAASDIVINSSSFDCMGNNGGTYFWGKIDCAYYNLKLKNATPLQNAVIVHADTLFCIDSSSIASISIVGPITLGGAFTVTDANVSISGVATIADTLQNGGGLGWLALNANGGIVNRGVIRNNPRGNAFNIAIGKNATNAGIWKNGQNTFIDSVNQTISLEGGKSIAAPVMFDALWTGGPYVWQKNGQNLSSTERKLSLDSINTTAAGVYRCKHDTAYSRTITVQQGSVAIGSDKPAPLALQAPIKFAWNLTGGSRLSLRIQSPRSFAYSLKLQDLQGRLVSSVQGTLDAGIHTVPIKRAAAGTYFAVMQTDRGREIRRASLIE